MARWLALISAAAAVAAALVAVRPQAVVLAVPGRASANLSIASSDDLVAVVWGARLESGSTDIYAAVSRDAGRTFGAPVRVSGVRADAQISGEQPPRVAIVPRAGGGASLVAVWTARGAAGTELIAARSEDEGRTFGEATRVPGSDAPGNRGWQAISVQPDGRVAAVWLDHRDTVPARTDPATPTAHDGLGHSGHGSSTDSVARAQLSKLYFGRVEGPDEPFAVAGGVCYCCKTALATGADGAIYAAWRHVYPGNIRDIAFTASRDGRTFAPPVRVSEDQWALDGCPENGPSIAVGTDDEIHVVWPTLVSEATGGEPALALFHATSADGRRFAARERLATVGTPAHPQVAINPATRSMLVVWDELRDGRRHVAAARGVAGAARFVRDELAASSSAPAVAPAADGFVVGWTDSSRTPSRIVIRYVQ